MHLESIECRQKKIFDKLHKFPGFYLVGGIGLALQMGHRISVDFDLFNEKDIPKILLPKIKHVFKDSKVEPKINHSE